MAPTSTKSKRPTIGLALGAGGARGCAHAGVLRRLDEIGVPIDLVAGTSAGALVGSVYLAGKLPLLERFARHLDRGKVARLLLELSFPRSGLLTGRAMLNLLQEIMGARDFTDLKRPMAIVATDLDSHDEVVIKKGSLLSAIRASIAIPGIFTPEIIDGRTLIDGGLVNPLPVSVLREMGADIVIGVEVNLRSSEPSSSIEEEAEDTSEKTPLLQDWAETLEKHSFKLTKRSAELLKRVSKIEWFKHHKEPSIFDILAQTTRITENQITRSRLMTDAPDILIQPAVGDIATLDFPRGLRHVDAGVRAADEHLHRLRELTNPPEFSQ